MATLARPVLGLSQAHASRTARPVRRITRAAENSSTGGTGSLRILVAAAVDHLQIVGKSSTDRADTDGGVLHDGPRAKRAPVAAGLTHRLGASSPVIEGLTSQFRRYWRRRTSHRWFRHSCRPRPSRRPRHCLSRPRTLRPKSPAGSRHCPPKRAIVHRRLQGHRRLPAQGRLARGRAWMIDQRPWISAGIRSSAQSFSNWRFADLGNPGTPKVLASGKLRT